MFKSLVYILKENSQLKNFSTYSDKSENMVEINLVTGYCLFLFHSGILDNYQGFERSCSHTGELVINQNNSGSNNMHCNDSITMVIIKLLDTKIIYMIFVKCSDSVSYGY